MQFKGITYTLYILKMSENSEETVLQVPTRSDLYPKIIKLKDFVKYAREQGLPQQITLTGTVKLHGTHADIVVIPGNEIRPQSRNVQDLRTTPDNNGFAAWTASRRPDLLKIKEAIVERYRILNPGSPIRDDLPVVMAGEFCGNGIQSKVALVSFEKHFVLVSIRINDAWQADKDYADISDEDAGFFNVGKGGFFKYTIDMNDPEKGQKELQALTDQVGQECPYALARGVRGRGEGIVWKAADAYDNEDLWFKTKDERFDTSDNRTMAKTAEQKDAAARANMFASAVVTGNRLEQGWEYLDEMKMGRDMKSTGSFVKWVLNDCLTEEKLQMKELKLSPQDVRSAISGRAKVWYQKKVDTAF